MTRVDQQNHGRVREGIMEEIGGKRSVKIKAVERWENEGGSICKDDAKTNEIRRRLGADSTRNHFRTIEGKGAANLLK